MRTTIALLVMLIAPFSPAIAQTQIDAATKQDVEDMLQLTGVRDQMQTVSSAMASQMASLAADRYKLQHPNGDPAAVQKAAMAAAESTQQALQAMPTDELIDTMIPVYQKYLTHSDIKAMNEFYATPTGQKLLKNSSAMTIEVMQAAMAVMKKRMPETQVQAEKAGAEAANPTPAQPK